MFHPPPGRGVQAADCARWSGPDSSPLSSPDHLALRPFRGFPAPAGTAAGAAVAARWRRSARRPSTTAPTTSTRRRIAQRIARTAGRRSTAAARVRTRRAATTRYAPAPRPTGPGTTCSGRSGSRPPRRRDRAWVCLSAVTWAASRPTNPVTRHRDSPGWVPGRAGAARRLVPAAHPGPADRARVRAGGLQPGGVNGVSVTWCVATWFFGHEAAILYS